MIKIAILSYAHLHADAYIGILRALPGVDFIGLSDDNPERGRHYAERFDTPFFDSHEALLAERPDGVIICSENSRHRPLVELAAARGVPILCEKPLATTVADAEAIVTACRNAGITLMTAFPMRFSAPLQELKVQLDAGALGDVYCLTTTNQGQMPARHRAWFVDPELAGGGALMDHIVHLADILHWWFGPAIERVYAQANHILHADTVVVETGGLVALDMADGRFATIDCSWSKPLNYPTWGGLTMEIVADRGLTLVDAFRQNLDVYQQDPPAHNWAFWGADADLAMVTEFVTAIRENRSPAVTGEDGLYAVRITAAAYESAASGMPVTMAASSK